VSLERDGGAALLLAAQELEVDGVEFLLARGVPANTAGAGGTTPLHAAVAAFSDDAAELLAASADPNAAKADGDRPLHMLRDFIHYLVFQCTDVPLSKVDGHAADMVGRLANAGADVDAPSGGAAGARACARCRQRRAAETPQLERALCPRSRVCLLAWVGHPRHPEIPRMGCLARLFGV
jgi:hypothetical protein